MQSVPNKEQRIKDLISIQNLLFTLQPEFALKHLNKITEFQQIERYPEGSFVFLRKHSDLKLNKTQFKYYETPYRILKRYKTNALLLPYNKQFYFNRIKREGKVSKNLCTVQRLSHLKPIKDVRKFLNLNISDQLLFNFFEYLKSEITPPSDATLSHPKVRNVTPIPLFENHDPQVGVIMDPPAAGSHTPSLHCSQANVKQIKLRSLDRSVIDLYLQQLSTDVESSLSNTSVYHKLIPRQAKQPYLPLSTCPSSSIKHKSDTLSSFSFGQFWLDDEMGGDQPPGPLLAPASPHSDQLSPQTSGHSSSSTLSQSGIQECHVPAQSSEGSQQASGSLQQTGLSLPQCQQSSDDLEITLTTHPHTPTLKDEILDVLSECGGSTSENFMTPRGNLYNTETFHTPASVTPVSRRGRGRTRASTAAPSRQSARVAASMARGSAISPSHTRSQFFSSDKTKGTASKNK